MSQAEGAALRAETERAVAARAVAEAALAAACAAHGGERAARAGERERARLEARAHAEGVLRAELEHQEVALAAIRSEALAEARRSRTAAAADESAREASAQELVEARLRAERAEEALSTARALLGEHESARRFEREGFTATLERELRVAQESACATALAHSQNRTDLSETLDHAVRERAAHAEVARLGGQQAEEASRSLEEARRARSESERRMAEAAATVADAESRTARAESAAAATEATTAARVDPAREAAREEAQLAAEHTAARHERVLAETREALALARSQTLTQVATLEQASLTPIFQLVTPHFPIHHAQIPPPISQAGCRRERGTPRTAQTAARRCQGHHLRGAKGVRTRARCAPRARGGTPAPPRR